MLLDAVRTQDEQLALQFKKTEEWSTVEEMMSDHGKQCLALRCGSNKVVNLTNVLLWAFICAERFFSDLV